MTSEKLCRYFKYLDSLRKSGAVNMFAASPYLAEAFGINLNEARKILRLYADTFSEKSVESRASMAEGSLA